MALVNSKIGSLPVKRFANWEPDHQVDYFITTDAGGVSKSPCGAFNLGLHAGEKVEVVKENYRILSKASGFDLQDIVVPFQCHTSNVLCLGHEFRKSTKEMQQTKLLEVDAVITNLKGMLIGVLTADCVPILLYDVRQKAIGAVHAGWRGTAAGILGVTILEMKKRWGVDSAQLRVGIAPCISMQNYQVGEELKTAFEKIHPPHELDRIFKQTEEGLYLDLVQSNVFQLLKLGIHPDNIFYSDTCTFDSPEFYSYRKANGHTGRFLTCIALR